MKTITDRPEENSLKKYKIIGIILIAFVFLGGLFALDRFSVSLAQESIHPQVVKSIFVDINGDGLIDFVSEAQVILNTGTNINFP